MESDFFIQLKTHIGTSDPFNGKRWEQCTEDYAHEFFDAILKLEPKMVKEFKKDLQRWANNINSLWLLLSLKEHTNFFKQSWKNNPEALKKHIKTFRLLFKLHNNQHFIWNDPYPLWLSDLEENGADYETVTQVGFDYLEQSLFFQADSLQDAMKKIRRTPLMFCKNSFLEDVKGWQHRKIVNRYEGSCQLFCNLVLILGENNDFFRQAKENMLNAGQKNLLSQLSDDAHILEIFSFFEKTSFYFFSRTPCKGIRFKVEPDCSELFKKHVNTSWKQLCLIDKLGPIVTGGHAMLIRRSEYYSEGAPLYDFFDPHEGIFYAQSLKNIIDEQVRPKKGAELCILDTRKVLERRFNLDRLKQCIETGTPYTSPFLYFFISPLRHHPKWAFAALSSVYGFYVLFAQCHWKLWNNILASSCLAFLVAFSVALCVDQAYKMYYTERHRPNLSS